MSWNLPDGTSDADIDAYMDPPVYCPTCDVPVTDGVCEWCGPIEDDTSWSPDWLAFAAHRGVDPDDESLTATDFAAWLDARKTSLAATTAATTGLARPLAGGAGHPTSTKEHTP